VEQWAAGAGIEAVLDRDAYMMPYLSPGGSTLLGGRLLRT
jgi:hypothetical protein